MQYRAKRTVSLGGGMLLVEGQTVDIPAGSPVPTGLEPVLERENAGRTLESTSGARNLDAPVRAGVIRG